VDKVSKGLSLPLINEIQNQYNFLDIIPISALKGDNMDLVKEKILEYLPKGEKYYPDEQMSDKDDRFWVSEIIREKIFHLTREEVPHSIAVSVEKFEHRAEKDILDIDAIIYVERESQKGIIIGRNGSMTKKIATLSRQDLEEHFEKKVFLRTWVKVLKNWRKDLLQLKRMGLD